MHKIMHVSSSPDMWQTTIEQEHTNLRVDPLTQELVDGEIIHSVDEPDIQESQMAEITEHGPDALFIEVIGDDEDEVDEAEYEATEEETEMEEAQEDWRGGPEADDIVPEDGMTEVDEGTYQAPEYMPPPPPYARSVVQPTSQFRAPAGFASLTPQKSSPAVNLAATPTIAKIVVNAQSGNPTALAAVKALAVQAKQGNPAAVTAVQAINIRATGGFGLPTTRMTGFAGDVIDTTGKVVHTATRPLSWAVSTVGEIVGFVGSTVRDLGRKI